ncbi:MAG: EAL domain-containing protein [Actinoplanes sp.]
MSVRLPSGAIPYLLVPILATTLVVAGGPGLVTAALAAAATAAGAASVARGVKRRGRLRLAWTLLGAGLLSFGLLGHHLGFLLLIALGSVAMVLVPVPHRPRLHALRGFVDLLLVGSSLLLLNWNLVIDASLRAHGSIVGALGDVLLATIGIAIPARLSLGVRDGGPFRLVGFALLLIALADSNMIRHPEALDGHSGAAQLIGLGLILFVAVRADRAATLPADAIDGRTFSLVLPYAAVVGSLVIGIVWMMRGNEPTAVAIWCRSVSIFLIVIRQMLILLENRKLTVDLESRVTTRTADLNASEMRFRALVEQSSDSLAILEPDSTVRWQSTSIERIFGYPSEVLLGRPLVKMVVRPAAERITAAIEEVLGTPGGTTVFEVTLKHADGSMRLAEMTITNLLDDPAVHGLVFNTRDISEAQELQDQLRHEAYHDALTGLVNRALFRERLEVAAARGECAVLFLDLDGFKEVNDSLGHAAGDELLVRVADRLRGAVHESHTVARLGGDEFAVIVESDRAGQDAEELAAHLLSALDVPIRVDGRVLHVGAGIGVATSADASDIEQLQRNADLAMYRAKDAGGGVYAVYHPGMHDELVHRLELAADLRHALDRDELVLHYQPTVDLRTGEIIGFEALVRWQHPTRGLVPPLDFIGVAEATGLIIPIGRWVLTEACRQAVAWNRPLKMAVNVSVRQFDHGDLATTVAEVLAETGMPANLLVLEMTESVLLTDTDENLARIVRLKALGVLLAMDDFGTGYSSLAYLRRFPMDVLKVDRSFVDRLGGDSEDEALVRTIIRLGQRFGMTTVAEGIENPIQLEVLRDMGCDHAQGYFLSRPVPAPEATILLETGVHRINA